MTKPWRKCLYCHKPVRFRRWRGTMCHRRCDRKIRRELREAGYKV